ncbi:winged helix-turn-helix transcriptional regulator [Gemmiger formicilis]|uniref:winged helix-turn-helix transcriptional regulator n=1 Tax=Gemmiger formicilis TaxID=745368 RepID=UPI003A521F53
MIYPRTQPRQPFTSESSNFSKIFQVAVAAVAAAVDGIITCTVYPEVPPRVEYALSDLGESMRPIMDAMQILGTAYKNRRNKKAAQPPPETHRAWRGLYYFNQPIFKSGPSGWAGPETGPGCR